MTNDLVIKAVESVLSGKYSYCKFLSANDSGETGGHQSGILISRSAQEMLFTEQEIRENHILKKQGTILWQDDFQTTCTFTWYESKKELRITGFGRGFELLRPEYTGALFVMIKRSDEEYFGYIFNTDEDIQEFLDSFGLTPAETNSLIELNRIDPEVREKQAIESFIGSLHVEFPTSEEMSMAARMIQYDVYVNRDLAVTDPDNILLRWTEEEYRLFRSLEHSPPGGRFFDISMDGRQEDSCLNQNQIINHLH